MSIEAESNAVPAEKPATRESEPWVDVTPEDLQAGNELKEGRRLSEEEMATKIAEVRKQVVEADAANGTANVLSQEIRNAGSVPALSPEALRREEPKKGFFARLFGAK